MNENQCLRLVVLKSTSSVPLGVRLWCCFKAHVLEKANVLASFQLALTETAFRGNMRPILRKYGPVELRRGSRTARRLERDSLAVLWRYYCCILDPQSPIRIAPSGGGLGLFARRRLVDPLPKELFGAIAGVEDNDFDVLVEGGYPSLYQTGGVSGILFGPMSLVNHSCRANFRFSNLISRGRPDGFDGFGIIRLKSKKKSGFAENEQILVNYGMRKRNFQCECDSCRDGN